MQLQKTVKVLTALILNIIPFLAFAQEGWSAKDSIKLSKMLDGEIPIHINDAFIKELEQSLISYPMGNNSIKFNDFILGVKHENSLIKYTQSDFRNLYIQYHLLSDSAYKKKSECMAIKKFRISSTIYTDCPNINLQRSTNLSIPVREKLYFNIYGNYTLDKSRNVVLPATSIPYEVGAGFSYNISKHITIKSQTNYQYNLIQKKWEWFFGAGITFIF
ncbi:hypothetical protein [Bacteroides sp. 41_26]|uniref:hypothetical protein n=1 Tax=Bacteroides sp. 41_26 TaxID=1896973 RepID=UPI00259C9706|nr:hypothetical protein [Bacteroides sp. 41_26]